MFADRRLDAFIGVLEVDVSLTVCVSMVIHTTSTFVSAFWVSFLKSLMVSGFRQRSRVSDSGDWLSQLCIRSDCMVAVNDV